ncbi:DUF7689 domain-containing protein [Microcoleus sp. herbarium13]
MRPKSQEYNCFAWAAEEDERYKSRSSSKSPDLFVLTLNSLNITFKRL